MLGLKLNHVSKRGHWGLRANGEVKTIVSQPYYIASYSNWKSCVKYIVELSGFNINKTVSLPKPNH